LVGLALAAGVIIMADVISSGIFPSLCEINFRSSLQIRGIIKKRYRSIFGETDGGFIDEYIGTVENLFDGKYPEYQAMDTAYHDITHTLQATLCLAELLFRRFQSNVAPHIQAIDFRRALVAVLLHDIGFLKKVDDNEGTGAKYSHIHEHRSCVFARELLEGRGWSEDDVRFIENLIRSH
jgi:hypothetical protein